METCYDVNHENWGGEIKSKEQALGKMHFKKYVLKETHPLSYY